MQYSDQNSIKIVNTEINKIIESYIFLLIEQELSSNEYDHCVQNIIKSKQVTEMRKLVVIKKPKNDYNEEVQTYLEREIDNYKKK